jgi:hypothetical protein
MRPFFVFVRAINGVAGMVEKSFQAPSGWMEKIVC